MGIGICSKKMEWHIPLATMNFRCYCCTLPTPGASGDRRYREKRENCPDTVLRNYASVNSYNTYFVYIYIAYLPIWVSLCEWVFLSYLALWIMGEESFSLSQWELLGMGGGDTHVVGYFSLLMARDLFGLCTAQQRDKMTQNPSYRCSWIKTADGNSRQKLPFW